MFCLKTRLEKTLKRLLHQGYNLFLFTKIYLRTNVFVSNQKKSSKCKARLLFVVWWSMCQSFTDKFTLCLLTDPNFDALCHCNKQKRRSILNKSPDKRHKYVHQTYHRENVGVVNGTLLCIAAGDLLFPVEKRHGQSEVSTECVDHHRAADVANLSKGMNVPSKHLSAAQGCHRYSYKNKESDCWKLFRILKNIE